MRFNKHFPQRKSVVMFSIVFAAWLPMDQRVAAAESGPRRIISLNGPWQVAEGTMDIVPSQFEHTVPVPGLVDMARPAFDEVGKKSAKRQAFWYRRTFTVGRSIPDVAILKIHKARYGTKVWLNGQLVGEHLPCFTPALMDVKRHLKGTGQENELVIRVGADRESRPKDVPSGWDFEKYLYIPGIYDSVELILSGEPFIVNIQTVPDIDGKKVRVIAELQSSIESTCPVTCEIMEAVSGSVVGKVVQSDVPVAADTVTKLDLVVPLQSCRLWTPEDPFLYRLRLSTGDDTAETRFGMRSFRFDAASGRAILNGKPYFMRGTNVCAYRFFEDAQRGDRPWRAEWVRRLHEKFKGMHWNSIRYCIGFPPEQWYDIADEVGFLIQDEFPIWLLGEDAGEPEGGEDHPRVYGVDARAMEPSVCGHLGRAEREPNGRNRQGPAGGAAPGPVESAVGERLGRAAEHAGLRRSPPLSYERALQRLLGKCEIQELEGYGQRLGRSLPAEGPAKAQCAYHHQRVRMALAQSRRHDHLSDRSGVREAARSQLDHGTAA